MNCADNSRNQYPTRHGNDLAIQIFNTVLCRSSFRHASINDRNALPFSLRNVPTKYTFKSRLRPKPKPDSFYGIEWTRISSINMSRIRCGNSNLNANLYRRNRCDSPLCSCGGGIETEAHYLLECPKYQRLRTDASWLKIAIYGGRE